MPRYVITLTGGNARRLENWLGGTLEIGPAGAPGAALVAQLDAITDAEFDAILNARSDSSPLYHHGGAAAVAGADPAAWHGPVPHTPPV